MPPSTENIEQNEVFSAPSHAGDHKITPRGAESRDKILVTALTILNEDGFAALSISNICKKADASSASLYHHFGDKAGLLNAMIKRAVDESAQTFMEAAGRHQSPLEQIDAFINMLKHMRRNSPFNTPAILLALSQSRGQSPETAQIVAQAQRYVWKISTERFSGFFGNQNAEIITHLHMAFMSYIAQLIQSNGDETDIDKLFESFRRLLIITAASICPDFLSDEQFSNAIRTIHQPA